MFINIIILKKHILLHKINNPSKIIYALRNNININQGVRIALLTVTAPIAFSFLRKTV